MTPVICWQWGCGTGTELLEVSHQEVTLRRSWRRFPAHAEQTPKDTTASLFQRSHPEAIGFVDHNERSRVPYLSFSDCELIRNLTKGRSQLRTFSPFNQSPAMMARRWGKFPGDAAELFQSFPGARLEGFL
jgi:hypothetical protein